MSTSGSGADDPKPPRQRLPRPRGGGATVRDVAAAAGVSVATVSRVLNGKASVAPGLRETVQQAALQLSYTPHAAAKALASQRFMTIGAIVPTLEDPNFAVGVAALQQRLNQGGYTLLLASSNYDPEEEFRQVQAMAAHGVAGLMLVGARRAPAVYQLLEAKKTPYINTWVLDGAHPCVGFDNHAIGRTVANYLLDLGHTEFGVIAQHSPNSDRAASRVAGVREALGARGIALSQERLIERSHKIIDGQLALRMMLQSPRPPTAVICGTDTLAFGAIVEALDQGLRVPQDLSVTGINDVEFAAHLAPPLTTIRLPAEEVGARAAEYLIGCIDGEAVVTRTPIPFSLIVRGSTARPGRPAPAAVAGPR
ncbi:MAG: substrate-binding domain-containing protein [Pseudomonadota bacterium]